MFKYFNKRGKKGQGTLEYAILVIIIIAALLSIQVYLKRGVMGRLKSAADDIGDQYSPGNTNFVQTTSTQSTTRDTFLAGVSKSTLVGNETTEVVTNWNIINAEWEGWGK